MNGKGRLDLLIRDCGDHSLGGICSKTLSTKCEEDRLNVSGKKMKNYQFASPAEL
jgi:hypothetical protein